jgi:cobalt-zinc-cadmium resistance protein CzcA
MELDIEARPDPVQPLVEVIALPSGLSAEEVEKLVTVPLEVGLAGMRGPDSIRSASIFGLSDLKCYFSWDSDYYEDRAEVIQRLGFVSLPQNVTPAISPENPIGEIYRYTVESRITISCVTKRSRIGRLKKLKTVPGVVDVAGSAGCPRNTTSRSTPRS